MNNQTLRALGRKHNISPSTITGWIKNGLPPNTEALITTILSQEELIASQAERINDLERTVKALASLLSTEP